MAKNKVGILELKWREMARLLAAKKMAPPLIALQKKIYFGGAAAVLFVIQEVAQKIDEGRLVERDMTTALNAMAHECFMVREGASRSPSRTGQDDEKILSMPGEGGESDATG